MTRQNTVTMLSNNLKIVFVIFCIMTLGACLILHQNIQELPITENEDFSTNKPVKAHMDDGTMVTMKEGFDRQIFYDSVFLIPKEFGIKYDLYRTSHDTVTKIPFSDVAFLETVTDHLDETAFFSSLPGTVFTYVVIHVAIFGSCPTYYSLGGREEHLEAEGFSYSISEKFELGDLDKLRRAEVQDGIVNLKIKNEAYETHYINQFQLKEVQHKPSFEAVPYEKENFLLGRDHKVFLTNNSAQIISARNSKGLNVLDLVREKDNTFYQSGSEFIPEVLANTDSRDYIDLSINPEGNKGKLFLHLKLRNSLLNTVLFYNVLLDKQNYRAIKWITDDSNKNLYAYQFYKWYKKYFGLTVEVERNGNYVEMGRIGDMGPISWAETGLVVDVKKNEPVNIRLSFLPDNWQIDYVGVSFTGDEDPPIQTHHISSLSAKDLDSTLIKNKLSQDDEEYFVNYPGHSIDVGFEVGKTDESTKRSWFIYSKGYYIEWLRNNWLEPKMGESVQKEISLDAELIPELYREWQNVKTDFEELFFETMVPTH